MSKYSCTIDASGISAPAYDEILSMLQADVRAIYGQDIYIEADSQDGQMLAVLAKAFDDSNLATIDAFNSFSPSKAQGAGLASNVKINGLKTQVASNGQVVVTIVGTAGKIITNGIVQDNVNLNSNWVLPPEVIIPDSGTIDVTATAVDQGDIRAAPGTITRIVTPFPGWQSVTNVAAATPGAPVEIDAQLRRRQAKSTATPAQAIREAIEGAVLNTTGVRRGRVFENSSGITDANGIPRNSISVVAEGGSTVDIATAVARRKTPGTNTYGNLSADIIDDHGVPDTIFLYQLTDVVISSLIFVAANPGYVSTTGDLIKAAVSYFLKNQDIGADSKNARLIPPAELSGTSAVSAYKTTVDPTTTDPQPLLDELSQTYDVITTAQARSRMAVTGGPFVAGATAVNLTSVVDCGGGLSGYLVLDNGTYFKITISSIAGSTINFVGFPIPAGRQVNNGTLFYKQGDIGIVFNEATTAETTDVVVVVS